MRQLKRRRDESTIDNGGTYTQLRFLGSAYQAIPEPSTQEAFLKGLDYLFESQYANGGWPI